MDLYDVMHTTFAARDFVDEDVPDNVIRRILDHARFASSGGNRQGWKVIVVRNAATREALVPLMAGAVQRYIAQVRAGESPWNTINPTRLTDAEIAAQPVPEPMIRKLTHAPVVLFVFVDLALVASLDQKRRTHRRDLRRLDLPVRTEHPARRTQRRLRRHAHHVHRRQRGGAANAARCAEADGLRRNDSVGEAGETADQAQAQTRGRLRDARALGNGPSSAADQLRSGASDDDGGVGGVFNHQTQRFTSYGQSPNRRWIRRRRRRWAWCRTVFGHGWPNASAHGWLERVRRTSPPPPGIKAHPPSSRSVTPRRPPGRQAMRAGNPASPRHIATRTPSARFATRVS